MFVCGPTADVAHQPSRRRFGHYRCSLGRRGGDSCGSFAPHGFSHQRLIVRFEVVPARRSPAGQAVPIRNSEITFSAARWRVSSPYRFGAAPLSARLSVRRRWRVDLRRRLTAAPGAWPGPTVGFADWRACTFVVTAFESFTSGRRTRAAWPTPTAAPPAQGSARAARRRCTLVPPVMGGGLARIGKIQPATAAAGH